MPINQHLPTNKRCERRALDSSANRPIRVALPAQRRLPGIWPSVCVFRAKMAWLLKWQRVGDIYWRHVRRRTAWYS